MQDMTVLQYNKHKYPRKCERRGEESTGNDRVDQPMMELA